MTKRLLAYFLFAVLGALGTLLAINLVGYGPAFVYHESVRVVLPPQAAAHHHTKHYEQQTKAAAPAAPVAQRVQVGVNVNVHAVQQPPAVAVPSYHKGVMCSRYQGCTHFWVDPPVPPSVSVLPDCEPGYIGRTCQYIGQ